VILSTSDFRSNNIESVTKTTLHNEI